MRLIAIVVALLVILAAAAWATRPGEAAFNAMLKAAVERRIATTDIGADTGDAAETLVLVGCKLRPSDCVKLLRESLDVSVEKHLFWTRYRVSGFKRGTSCTGAFTRVWCAGDVTRE
ncbi:MAG: hypothetical protein H6895_14695 [Defluviimonas sp.]|uniref:hypothetical protein n=1 Tax=Albidovulum sp. TaxID=1872424 RepID=UPI001DF680FE|nr:hypothetical protein [Paracoccaceae bacterium]MCC0065312.1 hypothetical protein [Defluviimonas sp.]